MRIQVTKLTRNITKDHLSEIFGTYGTVAHVEVPGGNGFSFSFRHQAFIEYESSEDAAKAAKFMDGGQIDGQEIMVTLMKGAPQRNGSIFLKFENFPISIFSKKKIIEKRDFL